MNQPKPDLFIDIKTIADSTEISVRNRAIRIESVLRTSGVTAISGGRELLAAIASLAEKPSQIGLETFVEQAAYFGLTNGISFGF